MKKSHKLFIIFALIIIAIGSIAATFRSGEEEIVSAPINDNLYIAGSTVSVNAVVHGDLIAAGRLITINDTISKDIIAAGEGLLFNGFIGDDAKIFGEDIKILNSITGDLIAFGESIQIHKDVVIGGDLVLYGGNTIINGTVNGKIKIVCKKVLFNGTANGKTEIKAEKMTIGGITKGTTILAANSIELEQSAQFHDSVIYRQKEGEINFEPYMRNAKATFNSELELFESELNWKHFGIGAFTFWMLYTLSVILTIFLFVILFGKIFAKAGERINQSYIQNLGYGSLYFIGLPLLIFSFFMIVIGIPIGILLSYLYITSLLFAFSISSVTLAYGINYRYQKSWNKWKIMLVAALIFPVLKIISFIPFIGILFSMIVVGMVFGAIILIIIAKKKEANQ